MIASTNQQLFTSVLFGANGVSWMANIRETLAESGYHVTTVATIGDVERIVRYQELHAVIVLASPESAEVIRTIRHLQEAGTPFFILIADSSHPPTAEHYKLADVVLVSDPEYLAPQIQGLMKLAADNHALRTQKQRHQAQQSETARKIESLEQKLAEANRALKQLVSDIEQQQRMTEEVEILKNAIVRNVSHELKTPLLQVKSAIALIKEDLKDTRLVEYAENATARLETHVKNITMLGSSLDINIGPIILRDAAEYARRNLSRVWQRKGEADRILLRIDRDLPPINADKQGLGTVLQLLIDNALKFSEDPIEVIGRRADDHRAYIAVKDTGIGIARDELKSIFDTFYQVDSSSTRRYGGAGVGLAIVKLILDHHNTEITVTSEPGKGSTFAFTLPFTDMG